MQGFKRVAMVALILLLVLLAVAFVLENHEPVSLFFLGFSTAELPVSVYVILALLLGMLLGPILGLIVGRGGSAKVKL